MQGLIGTTFTKYEGVLGLCTVVLGGSGPSETISYVFTDGLGGVSEALDGNGNVTAQQLYGPYGGVRYSSGTMPTAKGYTGQYADAASSGLDYYNARYYDPLVGQFTSADTAGDGLNRYAYVHDDPETFTDPTGNRCTDDGSICGHGNGKSGCTRDCVPYQVYTTTNQTSTTNPDFSTTTTYTTVTITVHPDGTISTTSHSWSVTTCDDSCHHQQDDARKGAIFHIVAGLTTVGGVFAALAVGCGGIQAILTCTADMSWLAPVGLQAAHWILDGLDTLHLLSGGSIGDAFTVFVRTARVAIDVAQFMFGLRDIPELIANLREAGDAIGALASIARQVTSSAPNMDTVKEGVDKLVAFGGFGSDFISDVQELEASENAWAASGGGS